MLKKEISSEWVKAFKAKDTEKKSTFSSIKAKIQEKEKLDKVDDLDDSGVQKIIEKYIKERLAAIEFSKKLGRDDLIVKEQIEIDILTPYLPQKLSEEETRAKVMEIIESTGASSPKDIGRIMGAVAPLGNTIDKGLVSEIAKELLG